MTTLSIGRASYDITCPVEGYPKEGTKNLLSEKIEASGGGACNVAYLLSKWGETSYFAGVVGSDDYGSKIKKNLEQVMVKTEYLETSYEVGTPISVTIVNKHNGSRTKYDIVSNNQPILKKNEYSIRPDLIFSDGKEYSAMINAINKFPNAISVVEANIVDRDLLELCKFVKYIICSKEFAEAVSGFKIDFNNSASLVNIYKRLKEKYPNNEIVVTLENMGAMYTVNGEIRIMPGIKTKVVDASGAGDIFHGALCYCLANSFDMEKAITYANIAAGLSLSKMGASSSVPGLKEVILYYSQKIKKEAPVEEKKEEEVEVKEEDLLPDIPDAATFKVIDPKDLEQVPTFSIGGAEIPPVPSVVESKEPTVNEVPTAINDIPVITSNGGSNVEQ